MNILYINHYAGSPYFGMEFRPYYLAREWVKMGHSVTIVAGDYSHLRKENPKVSKDFQIEHIDGIDYCWVKTGRYEGNGLKRAMTMFRFVRKLFFNAGKIANKYNPDIVIASSTYPIDTFAAQRIAKKANAELVHEVHDMWPVTPKELYGMSKFNPFVVAMQIGENSFCKKSDLVCSLLPNAKEYFVMHGMDSEHFFHIPNGVVLDEWDNPDALPDEHRIVLEKLKHDGKFVVAFFGSHTKSYNLDSLIKAVSERTDNVVAVFIGNGIYKNDLMKMSEGFNNIVFLPSIKKKSIPKIFDFIDATYVASIDTPLLRFGISMNKLFDSMMGGKPILYSINAPNNYIKEYNCGISLESTRPEDISNGIDELLKLSEYERAQLGENGRNAIKDNFLYNKLAINFMNRMEENKDER